MILSVEGSLVKNISCIQIIFFFFTFRRQRRSQDWWWYRCCKNSKPHKFPFEMARGSLAPLFVGHRKQRQQYQATDLIKRSLCSSVFESSSPCLVQFPTQSAVPTGCQFSPFWNVGKGVRWRPQKCCPANWR